MLISPGDKLAIAHRRLFADDKLRWFIGAVEAYEGGIARLTGHSWVQDPFAGTFTRKESLRTKLMPLSSAGLLVYVLPKTSVVERIHFETRRDGSLWLTDGDALRMDMTEGQRERDVA